MTDKPKFLWLTGLLPYGYTVSCSYCGAVVSMPLRTQHEDFHKLLKKLEKDITIAKIENLGGIG